MTTPAWVIRSTDGGTPGRALPTPLAPHFLPVTHLNTGQPLRESSPPRFSIVKACRCLKMVTNCRAGRAFKNQLASPSRVLGWGGNSEREADLPRDTQQSGAEPRPLFSQPGLHPSPALSGPSVPGVNELSFPRREGEAVPEPGNPLMSSQCRHGNYSPGLGA